MKAKPIEQCPVCKVPVRWILHDGLNSYDCSNEQCPIKFTERVWFPAGTTNFNFQTGPGILHYYGFQIDKYPCAIDYISGSKAPKLIIHPKYIYGDLDGTGAVVIDQPDIDWSDLERLKTKIQTWILFS